MKLAYSESIKYITSKGKFRINLGLERSLAMAELTGNPQEQYQIIHIAGTNGKGSVAAVIANILKYSGYKTGLYTSPHLVDYTERIKINGEDISQADFEKYINEICTTAEENEIDLTEFEILTAAAYKYFADNNVDIAVIETGLGGRFDATNIIKKPLVSIITSISFDHTDRLGKSIEQIAKEKSGIIKKGCSVIISADNKGYKTVKREAEALFAKLITVKNDAEIIFENGINYVKINGNKYPFALFGMYQKDNIILALEAVKQIKGVSDKAVQKGLETVRWPARFEYFKSKNLIIDGAHNPDGALQLRKSLDFCFRNQKRIFIYSSLKTKEYTKIADILFEDNDIVYYYEFKHQDALSFEEYQRTINRKINLKLIKEDELENIIRQDCLKIVTGSLYMIGQIYNDIINL